MGKIVTQPSVGPWEVLDIHDGLPCIKPKNTVYAVVSGMTGVAEGQYKVVAMLAADVTNCRGVNQDWSMFPDHHESWANRDLICAAPDLLSACKDAIAELHEYIDACIEDPIEFDYRVIRILEAAVAKAEGKRKS